MLQYNTSFVDNDAVIGILRRSYNYVDKRLMDHGVRVAYIVFRLLREQPNISLPQLRNICFLAALHDVGAYKTEEIDRMVQFESHEVWRHSIYGYLFIKNFTPLSEMAYAILFHHTAWQILDGLDIASEDNKNIAQLIYIADRLDIWMNGQQRSYSEFLDVISKERGERFRSEIVDLMMEHQFFPFSADDAENDNIFQQLQTEIEFTQEEVIGYLNMIIFSIDFRSTHTVTHTMTTTSISNELAIHMNLPSEYRNQIVTGAVLHDLGKIAIPVEILEYPGPLESADMEIMRSHVLITEKIIDGYVPRVIQNIAVRHHEKLNGTGYPYGLQAQELSLGERIVALADIVSALAGVRSYKESFGKEQIISIISQMKEDGLIDGGLVACMIESYDDIMEKTQVHCRQAMDIYENLQVEYNSLYGQYQAFIRATAYRALT